MPLAILTKRKELHGFLFLCTRVVPFSIIMGLRLAALRAAGAPLSILADFGHRISILADFSHFGHGKVFVLNESTNKSPSQIMFTVI